MILDISTRQTREWDRRSETHVRTIREVNVDLGLDDSVGLLARALSASTGGSETGLAIVTGADNAAGLRADAGADAVAGADGAMDDLTAARSSAWDFCICSKMPAMCSELSGPEVAAELPSVVIVDDMDEMCIFGWCRLIVNLVHVALRVAIARERDSITENRRNNGRER